MAIVAGIIAGLVWVGIIATLNKAARTLHGANRSKRKYDDEQE